MYLETAGNIRLEGEKCLNRLYRGVECRSCLEQCPAGALSVEEGEIRLDAEACTDCGLCLSLCPTGVFYLERWDEPALVEEILQNPAETAVLFCGRHPEAFRKEAAGRSLKERILGKGQEEPSYACYQLPMCLAGLSQAALFEIGAEKKLELMVDACTGCEQKDCLNRIRSQAKKVSEMLAACQGQSELYLVEQRPKGEEGRKRKAVPTGEQACSRREILFRLADTGRRALTKEKAAVSRRPQKAVVNEVRTGRKLCYYPEWAPRLKKAYYQTYQQQEEHGAAASWPAVRVKKDCTNCNLCASFCPTGALRIEVEEEKRENGTTETTAAHYFQPMLCADCRLCEIVCPMEAIVRDRIPNERPFITQIICKGPVVPCEKCGALTYNVKGGKCYWCDAAAPMEDIKQEVRKKLGLKIRQDKG